jgi:hypothetical protein
MTRVCLRSFATRWNRSADSSCPPADRTVDCRGTGFAPLPQLKMEWVTPCCTRYPASRPTPTTGCRGRPPRIRRSCAAPSGRAKDRSDSPPRTCTNRALQEAPLPAGVLPSLYPPERRPVDRSEVLLTWGTSDLQVQSRRRNSPIRWRRRISPRSLLAMGC